MKYVLEKTKESGYLKWIILWIFLILAESLVDAKSLLLMADTIKNPVCGNILWLALCLSIYSILNAVTIKISKTSHKMVWGTAQDEYVLKMASSDYNLCQEFSPSDLYAIQEGINSVSTYVAKAMQLIRNILMVVVVLVSMKIVLSATVLVPTIVIYLVGSIIIKYIFTKWTQLDIEKDAVKKERSKLLDDFINGYKEIFSAAIQNRVARSIIAKNDEVKYYVKKNDDYMLYTNVVISGVQNMATIAILLISSASILSGETDSAAVYTGLLFIGKLISPMVNLPDLLLDISAAKPGLKRLIDFLAYEPEVKDGSIELESFDDSIEISDIRYSYDKSSLVIDGISMDIKKGSKIGICGPTGGGKSTLLKLIPRFFDVDSGAIKIDGIDIREFRQKSLLSKIGIVHQDTFIFDGTIRDNIICCLPENVIATEEQIIDACKKACIYNFIMSQPQKFDTLVGARGMKLSGGQKQRIALARVFISNADIILLDEATSALDNETERLIQEALEMFHDKTMIIIAHRLSTIRYCDQIYVIANHKVVEHGTHVQLCEIGGKYAAMLE